MILGLTKNFDLL